jgi:hypothetical protein
MVGELALMLHVSSDTDRQRLLACSEDCTMYGQCLHERESGHRWSWAKGAPLKIRCVKSARMVKRPLAWKILYGVGTVMGLRKKSALRPKRHGRFVSKASGAARVGDNRPVVTFGAWWATMQTLVGTLFVVVLIACDGLVGTGVVSTPLVRGDSPYNTILAVPTTVDVGPGGGDESSTLRLVLGKPTTSLNDGPSRSLDIPTPVSATSLGGFSYGVLIATQNGLFRTTSQGGVEELDIVLVGDSQAKPVALGSIHQLVQGLDNTLVLTSDGLFVMQASADDNSPQYVVPSPLNEFLSGYQILCGDSVIEQNEMKLWLGTEQGVYLFTEGRLEHWVLEGLDEPVVSILQSGRIVFVATATRLLELDLDLDVVRDNRDIPAKVTKMKRGDDGTVYLATSQGLVVREPDGTHSHYTLTQTQEGAAISDVWAVAGAGAYILYEGGLVHLRVDGTLMRIVSGIPNPQSLAFDDIGNLWIATSTGVTEFKTATLTFTDHVQPIFQRHCASCHSTQGGQAPVLDNENNLRQMLKRSLTRIEEGTMPPVGAGLSENETTVVQRWAQQEGLY